jgi:hypothetical protein
LRGVLAPPRPRRHLVPAVRDLDAAARAYAAMLGRTPSWHSRHPAYGTINVLFGLGNCYLELLALDAAPSPHPIAATLAGYLERRAEGLFAIAFGLHTFALILRWYISGRWPNSNMFEAVTTSSWFGAGTSRSPRRDLRRHGVRDRARGPDGDPGGGAGRRSAPS